MKRMVGIAALLLSGWLSDRYDNRKLLFWYYGLRGLSLFRSDKNEASDREAVTLFAKALQTGGLTSALGLLVQKDHLAVGLALQHQCAAHREEVAGLRGDKIAEVLLEQLHVVG